MKRLLFICIAILLLSTRSIDCYAYVESGPASPPPSSGGTTIGPGSGGGSTEPEEPGAGGGSGSGDGEVTIVIPPYEEYTVYTPKVTQLRNINARAVMKGGEDVYYIPTLDSIPFDLKAYVSDITLDDKDKHKFALVYDGYFDTEALVTTAKTKDADGHEALAYTSPKVCSSYVNTLALSTIGYDLLLEREEYSMAMSGQDVNVDYYPETVFIADTESNSIRKYKDLKYQTAVMDIYKALGVYEYEFKFAFGEDPDFDADQSPILEQLSVLTSKKGHKGLDISESNTYVATTRTNPKRYWNRYTRELVATGDLVDEDISTSIHTSVCKSQNSTLTLGEFCSVARALMNLYGEPVVTAQERKLCQQLYNIRYPQGTLTDEIYESVIYLSAKGIIEPEGLDLNKIITYEDIDSILGRIANESARLTLKTPVYTNTYLQERGYSEAEVNIMAGVTDYTEEDKNVYNWFDFYILKGNKTTYYAELAKDITEDGAVTSTTSEPVLPSVQTLEVSGGLKLLGNGAPINPSDKDYLYKGVVQYDGNSYYHFKVKRKYCEGSNISFTYDYAGDNLKKADIASNGVDVITLPNADGGVYTYDENASELKWKHSTFEALNFDRTFVDKTNVRFVEDGQSTSRRLITFYKDATNVTESILRAYDVDGYNWSQLMANGLNSGKSFVIKGSGKNRITCTLHEPTQASNDKVRFEIITSDIDKFKQSAFYQQYMPEAYAGVKTGYYRADDNSLLVSAQYLKSVGILSAITPLADKKGYILTSAVAGTNITINTDLSYIIVGDTMYPKITDETLLYESDGDIFVNYRACLGWASNYVVVPDGNGSAVYACTYDVVFERSILTNELVKVNTLFPNSHTSLLYSRFQFGNNAQVNKGLNMGGSYALSPYLIVMDSNGTKDGLFVYHLREATKSDGTKCVIRDDVDEEARAKFKAMTGINLGKSKEYALRYFPLKRSAAANKNYNLRYASLSATRANTNSQDIVLGYYAKPKRYKVSDGGIVKAMDDYIDTMTVGIKSKDPKNIPAIPIIELKNGSSTTYYDVNVNFCKENATSDVLPAGTLPGGMQSNVAGRREQLTVLKPNATVEYKSPDTSSANVAEYKIIPAPAGIFTSLKLLGKSTYDEISSGALYYGTSLCEVKNEKVYINNHLTTLSTSDNVQCSYKGMSNYNSVYISTSIETSLGKILEEIDDSLEALIDDPANLVDWGQYKFDRLVKNLDAWSTVVLIFVLNILPRVAMAVFFILMLLSLINNVKPWRMFCTHVFDVYKFLTFGHISVDTVDMKRLLITSLICLSLFAIIMDGQLFNFIIWVAKFFIALYQH